MHLSCQSILECKKLVERVAGAISRKRKPARYTRAPWGICFPQSRLCQELLYSPRVQRWTLWTQLQWLIFKTANLILYFFRMVLRDKVASGDMCSSYVSRVLPVVVMMGLNVVSGAVGNSCIILHRTWGLGCLIIRGLVRIWVNSYMVSKYWFSSVWYF